MRKEGSIRFKRSRTYATDTAHRLARDHGNLLEHGVIAKPAVPDDVHIHLYTEQPVNETAKEQTPGS